jgi:hypothetical protein
LGAAWAGLLDDLDRLRLARAGLALAVEQPSKAGGSAQLSSSGSSGSFTASAFSPARSSSAASTLA